MFGVAGSEKKNEPGVNLNNWDKVKKTMFQHRGGEKSNELRTGTPTL